MQAFLHRIVSTMAFTCVAYRKHVAASALLLTNGVPIAEARGGGLREQPGRARGRRECGPAGRGCGRQCLLPGVPRVPRASGACRLGAAAAPGCASCFPAPKGEGVSPPAWENGGKGVRGPAWSHVQSLLGGRGAPPLSFPCRSHSTDPWP